MNKLVKDGKVAVIYAPGYGSGWSTWNGDDKNLVFDAALAEAVLADDKDRILQEAERIHPKGYWGGARDLSVKWLDEGTGFRITEYDGFESVETADALVMVA